MNEPFDVEISRALKEGAAKSLEGWEFTPAMRARVMDRIRAEAADETAPQSPPSRRFDPVRLARPLAWVAVAAAAMVIAINTNLIGGSQKATESKPAAPSLAAAPKAAPTAPESAGPSGEAQQDTRVFTTASPKMAQEPATGSGAVDAAAASSPAPAPMPQMLAFELTAPPTAMAKAEATMAPAAPPQGAPRMALAATAASNIAGAVPGSGAVLTLTPFGVKAVDYTNATVWERPLADLNHQSIVAGGVDGYAAVANGGDLLYLVNQKGELDKTLHTAGRVEQLAWSNDGRVAAVEETKVSVYGAATGKVLFSYDAGAGSQVGFAPDGMLAVYSEPAADAHLLALLDAKGNVVTRAQPAAAGRGLAVTNDGNFVVAGGQAYDRTGKPLWQFPIKTDGVVALGASHLVAWNAATVLLVNAWDGRQYVWRADWGGVGAGITKVVPSADGRFVVIVAPVDDGAILWVVGPDGRQMMTEKLSQMPVDIGVAGDQIALILPGTVEYRTVPQPQ